MIVEPPLPPAGVLKINVLPPAVNLYFVSAAISNADVPVSAAMFNVWSWLPAAAVLAVVPIAKLEVPNVSQVPFCVRALVAVLPSNEIDVLATLLLSELSVTTNLSPLAIVISLVCNVPPFWIFPCVCVLEAYPLCVWSPAAAVVLVVPIVRFDVPKVAQVPAFVRA